MPLDLCSVYADKITHQVMVDTVYKVCKDG